MHSISRRNPGDKTTQAQGSTTNLTPSAPTRGVGVGLSRESLCPGRPDLLERLEARFWGRVQTGEPEVCWLWEGPVGRHGYGACSFWAHLWAGTYKDNGRDMARKGRDAMAKLNPEKVRSIRARYAAGGVTQKELAEEHEVASAHISSVIRGLFWSHVS